MCTARLEDLEPNNSTDANKTCGSRKRSSEVLNHNASPAIGRDTSEELRPRPAALDSISNCIT